MKKSFQLEIKTPCDADLKAMDKTNNGFFCNLCTKDVIDLSQKTNYEISKFISENKNKSICARLKTSQLEEKFDLLEQSKSNNFKYAVAVAASVLLTTNVVSQETPSTPVEQTEPSERGEIMGKVAFQNPKVQTISFVLKGKLLNEKTKKPLSAKDYPGMTIYINGAQEAAAINPKTGAFSIPITIDENVTELYISINREDFYLEKTITLNTKSIKKNVLNRNITINPKNFHKMHIAGGIGVIDAPNVVPQEKVMMGEPAIIENKQ